MVDIIHRIGITASPAEVYDAIATVDGVAGWWTRHTTGESKVGGVITVRFLDHGSDGRGPMAEKGRMDLEVSRLDPGQAVRWRVTAGPPEWIGTTIDWRLSHRDGWTIVRFAHRGWAEPVEFLDHCSTKWATFLLSLKELVETGRGRPSPDDLKIDNWN